MHVWMIKTSNELVLEASELLRWRACSLLVLASRGEGGRGIDGGISLVIVCQPHPPPSTTATMHYDHH